MSVDMISYVSRMKVKDFEMFNRVLLLNSNCKFWIETNIKNYKYNFNVEIGKSSYYVGYHHNSEKFDSGYHSLKLQYNPNKLNDFDDVYLKLINYIFSKNDSCLKSLDIACDLKVPYGNFIIDKALKRNVNVYNGTFYIGERSNGVKIYDKQRESGLRDPQTRYELRITFDKCLLHMVEMLSEFEGMQLPAITIIDSLDNIEAFDKAVLLGLLEEPTLINSFSRRKKEKYKNYLKEFNQFCPNPKEILQCIKEYIKQLKKSIA